MNPEWLRYYVALAETKNFHQAAERLHITPQALSKAIAGLEAELKLSLVDRGHRVRGLTAPGEALLEEARQVLQSVENAERRMAEWLTGDPRGPVTIGGDSLWHHYLLPPMLVDLAQRYPGLCPKLYEMLPEVAEHWVSAGELEIGLLLRPPVRQDLTWTAGLSSPYVIAGRPQPKGVWSDFGYIVPRFFRKQSEESLDGWPEGKFPRRIVAEVELLETAIHLAEAGVGVAFLPELAVRERIALGRLAVVADPVADFEDKLYVVRRKGIRPTPAARAVLEVLGAL
ncbi:MAG: LysR family transcriptional regulator [Cyanobacteria bacterium RYN_339]|nr:LysR family transcriptional regulator [Cyanobacteria bacterium RYN_339]